MALRGCLPLLHETAAVRPKMILKACVLPGQMSEDFTFGPELREAALIAMLPTG